VAFALAAVAAASGAAPALGSEELAPGQQPDQLEPAGQPEAGAPPPDELRWNSPRRCRKDRFRGRPGTKRLYAFIEQWWPQVENWGYGSKPCRDSLHDEGRAVDVHLDVRVKRDRRAAHQLRRFLLRADSDGEPWAMARRFGIQELIWNCRIWTSSYAERGWRRYSLCDDPDTDYTHKHKNHVHIGQTWRGARRKTTAYTGYTAARRD
jgi:hypothetical protein